jgi:agmatinase
LGGYDAGRLNLPFVGHCTFNKAPPVDPSLWQQRLAEEQPDFAVLGVPFDCGTQYRAGARFGPRAIRAASTLYSFGHGAVYDPEDDFDYTYGSMVDLGDVDIVHTDTVKSHENVRDAVRMLLSTSPKTIPVVMGGDHSITAPVLEAYDEWCAHNGSIHVVQFDAHLDFVDVRHGVRYGHGNCMRRAAELPYVTGQTQLGIRSVSSTNRSGYEAARSMGSTILSVRQVRELGVDGTLATIPESAKQFYITVDIDNFCPSIAPGTGTPSHGGFLFYEVQELIKALTQRGRIVGLDVMEVAPDYDPTDSTAMLAARVMLDTLGYIKRWSHV